MRQIVSFDKLKLTNNLMDDNGHVSNYGTANVVYCLGSLWKCKASPPRRLTEVVTTGSRAARGHPL